MLFGPTAVSPRTRILGCWRSASVCASSRPLRRHNAMRFRWRPCFVDRESALRSSGWRLPWALWTCRWPGAWPCSRCTTERMLGSPPPPSAPATGRLASLLRRRVLCGMEGGREEILVFERKKNHRVTEPCLFRCSQVDTVRMLAESLSSAFADRGAPPLPARRATPRVVVTLTTLPSRLVHLAPYRPSSPRKSCPSPSSFALREHFVS